MTTHTHFHISMPTMLLRLRIHIHLPMLPIPAWCSSTLTVCAVVGGDRGERSMRLNPTILF